MPQSDPANDPINANGKSDEDIVLQAAAVVGQALRLP
jgi:hypothetical protein